MHIIQGNISTSSSILQLGQANFVGRYNELNRLTEAYKNTSADSGGIVIVEGESGSGKSQLISEFCRRVENEGAYIFHGQGLDQSALIPFEMFQGVAQGIVRYSKQDTKYLTHIKNVLDSWGTILGNTLPVLREVLEFDFTRGLGPEDFGEERSIRALSMLLSNINPFGSTAVIVLDDCQWCDGLAFKTLLAWSRHISTSLRGLRILAILAFRTEEVGTDHQLRHIQTIDHISLPAFSNEEMHNFLEGIGGEVTPDALAMVSELSGGKPFMASTVFRGLIEMNVAKFVNGAWVLVDQDQYTRIDCNGSDSKFLRNRFGLLTSESLRFMKAAAIVGKEFDTGLVAKIADLNMEQATKVIEDAVYRALLTRATTDDTTYRFLHDKLRETVLEMIEDKEFSTFHKTAAEVLATSYPEEYFAISFHYNSANDNVAAIPYALKAARLARERSVLELAEQQFRIALRGIDELGNKLEVPSDYGCIVQDFGDVLILRGKFKEAESYLKKALASAPNELAAARAEASLAELMFRQGELRPCQDYILQALARLGYKAPLTPYKQLMSFIAALLKQLIHILLPTFFRGRKSLDSKNAERDLLFTRLCNRLSYACWFQADILLCFLSLFKALNCIERYQHNLQLSFTWANLAPGTALFPIFPLARYYGRRAEKMSREFGDLWCIGHALSFYAIVTLSNGRFSQCIEQCSEAVKYFERTGDNWEANIAATNLAYALYRSGNLKEALRLAKKTYSEALESEDRQSAACCLSIWSKCSGGDVPLELVSKSQSNTRWFDSQSHNEFAQLISINQMANGHFLEALESLRKGWQVFLRGKMTQEYMVPIGAWYFMGLRCRLQSIDRSCSEFEQLLQEFWSIRWRVSRISWLYANSYPQALREEAIIRAICFPDDKIRPMLLIKRSIKAAKNRSMEYEKNLSELSEASLKQKLYGDDLQNEITDIWNRLKNFQDCPDFHRLFLLN